MPVKGRPAKREGALNHARTWEIRARRNSA